MAEVINAALRKYLGFCMSQSLTNQKLQDMLSANYLLLLYLPNYSWKLKLDLHNILLLLLYEWKVYCS